MKKVLAIDDDHAILEMLTFILEDSDYSVTTSDNGKVMGIINDFKPDVILLDVLLSGEDGRDIAKKLKTDKSTKKIPLVMLSAHPSASEGAKIAGADDFIEKPFDVDRLLDVVGKLAN